MGVILFDGTEHDKHFAINFWHWHTIVEAIRGLGILPDASVQTLHDQYIGSGLTKEESRSVAAAIRTQLLPTLRKGERLLLDGSKTTSPYDGTIQHGNMKKNYSTDAEALQEFVEFCESCNGFEVC